MVVVLASVRGVFVYHFNLSPDLTYAMSGILLGCYGLLSFHDMQYEGIDKSIFPLKEMIKINIWLLGFYTIAYMYYVSFRHYDIAYSFIIFPIILTLVKYDEALLEGIVIAVAVITIYGIQHFYFLGVTGGFDAIADANLVLRPGDLSYGRIGDNLLPAGYQGDHHDAANILVMCNTFFICKSMRSQSKSKNFYILIYCLGLYSILLTGSAANITVSIAANVIALLLYKKLQFRVVGLLLSLFLLTFYFDPEIFADKLYFLDKLTASQSALEGGGMFNSLDMESIIQSIFSILFGFGYAFSVPMMYSEIAFVKILVGFGLFPFVILLAIVFSPIRCIYAFRTRVEERIKFTRSSMSSLSVIKFIDFAQSHERNLKLTALPVFAGSMTLLHYGSLLRVTSIGLFCVLIALFMKEYSAVMSKKELRR